MDKAKGVYTPMISSCPLSKHVENLHDNPHEYWTIAKVLQYVVLTQPNIVYVVTRIFQFMHTSTNVTL